MAARPRTTPLWLRGLHSRPLVNALLLVLVSVAVATAVLGPLLVRGVHQFTVQSGVAAAPRVETTIVLSVPAEGDTPTALTDAYGGQSNTVQGVLDFALMRSGSSAQLVADVLTRAAQHGCCGVLATDDEPLIAACSLTIAPAAHL